MTPVSTASSRAHSRAVPRLTAALERAARRRPWPAPQVLVSAPGWQFEFGDVSRPFHAASSGKLMTATLVAMLVERGRARFDSTLGSLLPASDLAGLPAEAGVDVARDVTLEQLLAHTSGFPDFFEPPRGHDTAASFRALAAAPSRRWTPRELLDEARKLPAVGRPGERFRYSDTNYVLLGRIAEELAGEAFASLLRTHIFGPSGMERSSTPYDATLLPEDLAGLDVEPFWIGRHELSRAHSVSADWAGGNVVAPPADFVRFQRALHGGRLVSTETVEHLVRPRHRFRRGIHYGAGTMTLRFAELDPLSLRGLSEPVGHLGFWASHVFYHREHDAHVVLNFHSDRRMRRSFLTHARIARILATGG